MKLIKSASKWLYKKINQDQNNHSGHFKYLFYRNAKMSLLLARSLWTNKKALLIYMIFFQSDCCTICLIINFRNNLSSKSCYISNHQASFGNKDGHTPILIMSYFLLFYHNKYFDVFNSTPKWTMMINKLPLLQIKINGWNIYEKRTQIFWAIW